MHVCVYSWDRSAFKCSLRAFCMSSCHWGPLKFKLKWPKWSRGNHSNRYQKPKKNLINRNRTINPWKTCLPIKAQRWVARLPALRSSEVPPQSPLRAAPGFHVEAVIVNTYTDTSKCTTQKTFTSCGIKGLYHSHWSQTECSKVCSHPRPVVRQYFPLCSVNQICRCVGYTCPCQLIKFPFIWGLGGAIALESQMIHRVSGD